MKYKSKLFPIGYTNIYLIFVKGVMPDYEQKMVENNFKLLKNVIITQS